MYKLVCAGNRGTGFFTPFPFLHFFFSFFGRVAFSDCARCGVYVVLERAGPRGAYERYKSVFE